jgi:hypothetical protein
MTWKTAIATVLEKAGIPLHANEIAARIKAEGIRQSLGATPEAPVGAQVYMSIKTQGDKSPFIKVAKQTFALKNKAAFTQGAKESLVPKNKMTWEKAIITVLGKAAAPLHVDEIVERIKTNGLRQSLGATPEDTVGAHIYRSIKTQGDKSPFVKVAKQTFALKGKASPTPNILVPLPPLDAVDEPSPIVTSFGMFWRRDSVKWETKAKILGKQANADTPVDFGEQKGIYFLYDGRELIYVGRASDQPIGKRLFQHTSDRFATRWDCFSWFGLRPVSEEGKLGTLPDVYSSEMIIPVLEALLIEATEPRQNRKAGDDWTDKEYMQVTDPAIQKAQLQAMIAKL